MVFSTKIVVILGGILAVLTYLQSELNVSHTIHIAIGAALIFLAAIGINNVRIPKRTPITSAWESISSDPSPKIRDRGNSRG